MADSISTIGFIGTGLMGEHMARNLFEAGYKVVAWNRTISKAETLRPDGAIIASSAHEAVKDADMVVTMLADGQTVADVMFAQDVSGAMKSDAVLVDMSSIKPKEARQHEAQMKQMSLGHLDAPVSGGTKGAEAGTLAIMAGGDEAIFERCKKRRYLRWAGLCVWGRPVQDNYQNWQTRLLLRSLSALLPRRYCWPKKAGLTLMLSGMR